MFKFLPVSFFLFVMIPASLQAEILFHEDFESGVSPFSFNSESNNSQDGAEQYFTGALVSVPGERGNVWRNTFHPHCNDSYFGFRLRRDWAITNKFHWRAFVKFGDSDNSPEWATVPAPGCGGIEQQRSYELKFPDVGGGQGLALGRIIGKLRADGSDSRGMFFVYTPNGQNHYHTAQGTPSFVSNRWYMVEFMVEDNGSNDVVKIWVDNNDPNDPDYEHIGGNMFDSSQWSASLGFTHGYRNHNVPRDANFYFDGIAISTTFIGLGDGSVVVPGIPGLD